jgi:hypothetical protein
MTTDKEYIYLLHEREFIRMNEPVYKIGKTKQDNHSRFFQYPKGSILLLQIICNDCGNNEKEIKKLFKDKYKQRKDYGNEYFEGDYNTMITDIFNITIKNNKITIEPAKKEIKENPVIVDDVNNLIQENRNEGNKDEKEKKDDKKVCLTLQPHLQSKDSYKISSNQPNLYNLLQLQYNIQLEHLKTLVITLSMENENKDNAIILQDNEYKFIEISSDMKNRLITHKKEKEKDKYTLLFTITKMENNDTIWIKGALQHTETKNIMLMTSTNNKSKLTRPIKTLDETYFIGHYGMCAPLIFWNKLLEVINA